MSNIIRESVKLDRDRFGRQRAWRKKYKEDIGKALKEGKHKKSGKKEIEKSLDVSQELKIYREAWKKEIGGIVDETKEKIIKAAKKIPIKVETDSDGSRLIELKLGNKTYKILDPKLRNHLDHGGSSVDFFDTAGFDLLFHGWFFQDDGEKGGKFCDD